MDTNCGAKSDAISDSDLAEVIAAWGSISPAYHAAIMLWVWAAAESPIQNRRQ
jgi:hypothetical protein